MILYDIVDYLFARDIWSNDDTSLSIALVGRCGSWQWVVIKQGTITHTIHGTGIFSYIYHKHQPNVGKYTSPMDSMGNIFILYIT